MKILKIIFILIISIQAHAVNKSEMFQTMLAYIPSILASSFGKIGMTEEEKQMMFSILSLTGENLPIDDQNEYLFPRNFKNFKVVMSQNEKDFDLVEGEKRRSAYTTADLRYPIVVNENLVNALPIDPPEAAQILIHEAARKVANGNMQAADSLAAKVKAYLNQQYSRFSLGNGKIIHILNLPTLLEHPQIEMDPRHPERDQIPIVIVKIMHMRKGREILFLEENVKEFKYVSSLQSSLMDQYKSMNYFDAKKPQSMLATSLNIKEIKVDQKYTKSPLLRMTVEMVERAYRLSKRTEDEKETGEVNIQSLSKSLQADTVAGENDEILKTNFELTLRYDKHGNAQVTKREAINSTPEVVIKDLKWQEAGDEILGKMTLESKTMIKANDYNLRVHLLARMNDGTSRIEINRMEIKGHQAEVDFKLPSVRKSQQSYIVEEVILKNKDVEMMVDMPETIFVKKPAGLDANLAMLKFESQNANVWNELKNGQTFSSGAQKFRMLFRSDVPLNEIYLYIQNTQTTHDPLIRSLVKNTYDTMTQKSVNQNQNNPLQMLMAMGMAQVMKSQEKSFLSESAVFTQNLESVIHLSASQIKQTQKGPYLWVEFEIPLNISPDRGAFTYDSGQRTFTKMIAVNQRMQRWKAPQPIKITIEGTHGGMKSCADLLKP